jgi:hypothetical protein
MRCQQSSHLPKVSTKISPVSSVKCALEAGLCKGPWRVSLHTELAGIGHQHGAWRTAAREQAQCGTGGPSAVQVVEGDVKISISETILIITLFG